MERKSLVGSIQLCLSDDNYVRPILLQKLILLTPKLRLISYFKIWKKIDVYFEMVLFPNKKRISPFKKDKISYFDNCLYPCFFSLLCCSNNNCFISFIFFVVPRVISQFVFLNCNEWLS